MPTDPQSPPEGFVEENLLAGLGQRSPSRLRQLRARARRQHGQDFACLPAPRRRELLVRLNSKIRSDPNGRGIFTSHDILPGSRDWPLDSGQVDPSSASVLWADVYFASARPLRQGWFYNATVSTLSLHVSRQIVERAEREVDARISEDDRHRARIRTFLRRQPNGNTEMRFAPSPRLDSLGGMTREAALAQWLADHHDWPDALSLAPYARFKPGYAYGQGLEIVAHEPCLTVDTLARTVREFVLTGERPGTGPAVDPAALRPLVTPLLEVHRWRWQARAARDMDAPPPPRPSPEALAVFQHESNAVRV